MCLISVQNLKEIHPGEGCFSWLKIVVNRCKEEEKCEENWAIFRKNISQTTYPIFFKFDM